MRHTALDLVQKKPTASGSHGHSLTIGSVAILSRDASYLWQVHREDTGYFVAANEARVED